MTNPTIGTLPKADCQRCRHRTPLFPDQHCYRFQHRPGDYCAQFQLDRLIVPAAPSIGNTVRG